MATASRRFFRTSRLFLEAVFGRLPAQAFQFDHRVALLLVFLKHIETLFNFIDSMSFARERACAQNKRAASGGLDRARIRQESPERSAAESLLLLGMKLLLLLLLLLLTELLLLRAERRRRSIPQRRNA
jgi:hypothetical protein